MNANKIILFFLCAICLLAASCSNEHEPEIYPIRFDRTNYTIRFGIHSGISFVDGGGVYELTASNPDVLGRFYIDDDTNSLVVFPKSIGKSSLTIKDVRANSSVTLELTVEDFYLSFKVDEIEGENTNLYLSIDYEMRFIRDADNSKRLKVFRSNDLTNKEECVADGIFEIVQSDKNIFTLDMALHNRPGEELAVFSYTMGGDGEYLNLFERYFEYDWDKNIASKSLPVKRIRMILTDNLNGCKISCSMQPF